MTKENLIVAMLRGRKRADRHSDAKDENPPAMVAAPSAALAGGAVAFGATKALSALELLTLALALGICVWAWDSGGVLALVGCFLGVVASFNRRSVLNGAFAGLWVGAILGGLFGGAIERWLAFPG